MKVYVLRENVVCRPHRLFDHIIDASTNRKRIFDKATQMSHSELRNKSSWKDKTYWVHIFDGKTGTEIDVREFDNNGRREGTFGKIVRQKGSRDQRVVGTWYKK